MSTATTSTSATTPGPVRHIEVHENIRLAPKLNNSSTSAEPVSTHTVAVAQATESSPSNHLTGTTTPGTTTPFFGSNKQGKAPSEVAHKVIT